MNRRKGTRVCYRCHEPKEKYNSNGYCPECDRIRHRERLAAIKEEKEGYVRRHQERRAREAALEESFERVERGNQPSDTGMFLDLNNPEPVFRDQINSLLRVGNASKVFGWKTF